MKSQILSIGSKSLKLITVLAMSAQIAAPSAFANPPVEGTGSSGGGNVSADTPLTYWAAQDQVNRLTGALPYVFQTMEFFVSPSARPEGSNSAEIYSKLFAAKAGRPTVYEVLPSVHFTLLQKGACHGPEGEADGSAFKTASGNEVCLSFERLVTRMNSATAPAKLIALMAHEVSHFLDTSPDLKKNETEAQEVQSSVESLISLKSLISFSDVKRTIIRQLDDVEADIKSTEETLNQRKISPVMLSISIATLSSQISKIQNEQSFGGAHDGYSLLTYKEQYDLIALLFKSSLIYYYLSATNSVRADYDKAFLGRDKMSVSELSGYLQKKSGEKGFEGSMDHSIMIRHIASGDKAAAIAELSEVKAMILKLHAKIEAIQYKYY